MHPTITPLETNAHRTAPMWWRGEHDHVGRIANGGHSDESADVNRQAYHGGPSPWVWLYGSGCKEATLNEPTRPPAGVYRLHGTASRGRPPSGAQEGQGQGALIPVSWSGPSAAPAPVAEMQVEGQPRKQARPFESRPRSVQGCQHPEQYPD